MQHLSLSARHPWHALPLVVRPRDSPCAGRFGDIGTALLEEIGVFHSSSACTKSYEPRLAGPP
jgi:hypothetical protein